MTIYCLFCQSQSCSTISKELEMMGLGRAISPKHIMSHRVQAALIDVESDFLPGYIFLYCDEPIKDLRQLFSVGGVIRLLGNASEGYVLSGSDEKFALMVKELNGVIGPIHIRRVDGLVEIMDPLFTEHHGEVLQLDIRFKRAKVQFEFHGNTITQWLKVEKQD